jgi:hypothetical protein
MKRLLIVLYCLCLILFMSLLSPAAFAQSTCGSENDVLNERQLPQPAIDEIIAKFAAHDDVFEKALRDYTYTEDVTVQTVQGNSVDGEYRAVTSITFDAAGNGVGTPVSPPQNGLTRVSISQEDLDELRNRVAFVLPTDDLPKYNIRYRGSQRIDEVDTYVFDVVPKPPQRGLAFQGRIWVIGGDLAIGKTCGQILGSGAANPTTAFETYRELTDGRFWFATYARADNVLRLANGDVQIREIVKFTGYSRKAGTP